MNEKIHTYRDYLETNPNDAISFEDCGKILDQIANVMDMTDSLYQEMWQDFISTATDYTKVRANFAFMSLDELSEKADARTAKHNDVITQLTALARLMAKDGHDISWTQAFNIDLGDPAIAKAKHNRRRIGDFANYLVYVNALSSRNV